MREYRRKYCKFPGGSLSLSPSPSYKTLFLQTTPEHIMQDAPLDEMHLQSHEKRRKEVHKEVRLL